MEMLEETCNAFHSLISKITVPPTMSVYILFPMGIGTISMEGLSCESRMVKHMATCGHALIEHRKICNLGVVIVW